MANALVHAVTGGLVGAVAGVLPDAALLLFAWRKEWMPEDFPLVRIHRRLHDWHFLLIVALASYSLHLLVDAVSAHNTEHTRGRGR